MGRLPLVRLPGRGRGLSRRSTWRRRSAGSSRTWCPLTGTTRSGPSGCSASTSSSRCTTTAASGRRDWADNDDYIREGREWYGYEGLAASGLDAVFENFLDGTATITSKAGWKWTDVDPRPGDAPGRRGAPVDRSPWARRSRTSSTPTRRGASRWCRAWRARRSIENELDRLDVLFGLGVRMCGITYSESNALGGGVKDRVDGGLTRFGELAVRRMNRLGMAIDLSHTGDVTAMQTCRLSERPVFLSHSGARALFAERKLKADDLLKAVADTGGVDRHRGLAAHDDLAGAPSALDRLGDGPLRVLRGADGDRPRGVRSRHVLRRPRGAAPLLRRGRSTPGRWPTTSGSSTWRGSRARPSTRTSCAGSSPTATTTSRSRR